MSLAISNEEERCWSNVLKSTEKKRGSKVYA